MKGDPARLTVHEQVADGSARRGVAADVRDGSRGGHERDGRRGRTLEGDAIGAAQTGGWLLAAHEHDAGIDDATREGLQRLGIEVIIAEPTA